MQRPMRRFLRLAACVAMAIPWVAAPSHALAAASARLVYVRGPGAEKCPGEEALRAAVGTRLGYDPFFAWAHDTLFVEITRSGAAFFARIQLVDDHNMQRGARDISVKGEDCSAVIDAIGLTTSLTIDPSNVMGAVSSSSAPPPRDPDPLPSPSPAGFPPDVPSLGAELPSEARVPARPLQPEPPSAHVGLGAIGSLGGAPAPAIGAALFAGLAWRAWSLDVEARADLPATGDGEPQSSSRVTSWLMVGSIVPCLHLRIAFGCAVASGGALGATSSAVLHGDAYGSWGAFGARAGVEVPLSRTWSLRGYAELLVPFLTPRTLTIDHAEAYRFNPFSGDVGFAAMWRFARVP
jgi:hypothetical protein